MRKNCEACGRSFKARSEKTRYCCRDCYNKIRGVKEKKTAPKRLYDLKTGGVPPLEMLSAEELLHYGRVSARCYLEQERNFRRTQQEHMQRRIERERRRNVSE